MNSIDMLIKMKKQQDTDDLMKMFDEVVKYEKLAKTPAFVDIKASAPVQKKLPLLANAVNGDLYSLVLLQTVSHVVTHVGEELPGILPEVLENVSKRNMQRVEIIGSSMVHINYLELEDFDDIMKESVLMTLVDNEKKKNRSVAIITRSNNIYLIYQGILHMSEKDLTKTSKSLSDFCKTNENVRLNVKHYSVLGNNGYRFAEAIVGDITYDVMMPFHDTIWLIQDNEIIHRIKMSVDEINEFNFIKTDISKLTEFLLEIITKAVIE